MSRMAEAHAECIDRGIDPESPEALRRLWNTLTPDERREVFPYATTVETTKTLTSDEFVSVVSAELKTLDEGSPVDFVHNTMRFLAAVRSALTMVEG